MESVRGTFDPDLDLLPRQARPQPMGPVEGYQRFVANPLLGVLGWIIAFALVRESIRRHQLEFFVWAMLFVVVGLVFLQFHCLDCGKTGCLLRARVHICAAVVARRQSGVVGRFHGPGIKTQLVAWFVILAAGLVLGALALGTRP